MLFPGQTLVKELIISQKLLQVRKVKHCQHVIYTKLFLTCKDFLFLTRNSQVTASCVVRGLPANSACFPPIQDGWFF